MSTYRNQIDIQNGVRHNVQDPSDDRSYYTTIADAIADIASWEHYRWTEFQCVYIAELHTWCAWLDINTLPAAVDPAWLIAGTVGQYPAATDPMPNYPDRPGFIQYDGRTFGLYQLASIPVSHVHVVQDITDITTYYYDKTEIDAELAGKQDNLPANLLGVDAVLQSDAVGVLSWVLLTTSGLTPPPNTGDDYGYEGTGWRILRQEPQGTLPVTGAPGLVVNRLQIPVQITLPAGNFDLQDPSLLPNGYNVVITHDGVSTSNLVLGAYPVDQSVVTSYIIPQLESVWFGIVDNEWRRLNRIS